MPPPIAHPHLRIEHGHRVVVPAHLGGAHGVKDGGGNIASQPGQVFVALELRARLPFLGLELRQRRLRHDAPRDAQRIGGHLAVFVGAQVVGGDGGRVLKLRAAEGDRAPARGVEVAHAGGEGGTVCSGSPNASRLSGCTWYSMLA
jgi:hypothetical protein